jgi:hypothetical protein
VKIQGLDDREANAPYVLERALRFAHHLLESLTRLPPLVSALFVSAPAIGFCPPAIGFCPLAIGFRALAIGSHLHPEIA